MHEPNRSPLDNPLLGEFVLPPFDRIRVEHVEPAMRTVLERLGRDLDVLERDVTAAWDAIVPPLDEIGDRLARVWGVVSHLMSVRNSPELRAAHERVQPEVVAFSLRLGQSRALYDALRALRAGPAWAALDATRRRIVELLIRDAELSGVGLDGAARERFNAIQAELAELATRFSNNVLDATKAFALTLRMADDVAGLPPSLLALAAQSARAAGEATATAEAGPWRITLDLPSYVPFLEHSRRRELRERVYRAHVTRAASGAHDNTPLITQILRLRREQAHLLGFESYAALSLASKMAPDVPTVERLLEELRRVSFVAAQRDLDDLRALARRDGAPEGDDLQLWDVPFWAERLREARYDFTDEQLRPYFPLPHVLHGVFALAERLLGIRITPADGEAATWHPDVRFFRVRDADGTPLAAFFLDPYSRPAEKRGGAWMDECAGRRRTAAGVRQPVAYLVCNQVPPVDGRPSLMTFDQVETLFHEFGHGLQHMLTTVDHGLASGIRNVEWDAVELPSQFMENWCYHRATLLGLSRHVDTGATLPEALFAKIAAARTFRSGSLMLRQIGFALLDLELHHRWDPDGSETPFALQQRLAACTSVLPPPPDDRFLCSFTHIFAGGYAAGYYSYKWAEVLSADAFAAFEEAGLDDDAALTATGRRYRDTVLALGGSRPAMDVFRAFRDREPTTAALLRYAGLTAA
jgi:oligopeptidase A